MRNARIAPPWAFEDAVIIMRITPSGVRRQNASSGPVLTANIDEWIKDIAGKKGWHGEWAEVERPVRGRAAIQRSNATAKELAKRHGINPRTITKWNKRTLCPRRARGAENRAQRLVC